MNIVPIVALFGVLSAGCNSTSSSTKHSRPVISVADAKIGESDYGACVRLCEKQQQCAGKTVTETTVKICSDDCYSSLSQRSKRLSFVREMRRCLAQKCGEDWVACRAQISDIVAKGSLNSKKGIVAPLSPQKCTIICKKTFTCLGAGSATDAAVAGCVVGCKHATGEDAHRMQGILRCANIPCGEAFQKCSVAQKPS